jgi:hypothetical protein
VNGAEAYRRQSILTAGSSETLRLCLEAALREAISLSAPGGEGDRDRLRKLLSLARQGARSDEPGPGRDLHELAGHMLLKISRAEPYALAEAVGILSILVGAVRDWRTTFSGAMIPAWKTIQAP